jgi:hypothetical protein
MMEEQKTDEIAVTHNTTHAPISTANIKSLSTSPEQPSVQHPQ